MTQAPPVEAILGSNEQVYAANSSPNNTLTSMAYSIEFTKRDPRTSHNVLPMASALSSHFQRRPLDIGYCHFDTPLVLWGILWLNEA
jgi:hypothetical protein